MRTVGELASRVGMWTTLAAMALIGCSDGQTPDDLGQGLVDVPGATLDVGQVIDDGAAIAPLDAFDGDALPCKTDEQCPESVEACRPLRCAADGFCRSVAQRTGACDDGDPCTVGDTCKQGECSPGPNSCQCDEDKDCGKFEDDNACNGTLICSTTTVPHVCMVNKSTIVTCSAKDDTVCASNTCDPASGECAMASAVDGQPCVDDDPCTVDSACKAGKCAATETSKSWCQCQTDADCGAFDDDDLCTGTLYCDAASFPYACKVNPASVITCAVKEPEPCLANLCQPKTGKCAIGPRPDGDPCDDGNACSSGETCADGKCTAGTDACKCVNDKDCEAQEDGDLCNGTLYCDVDSAKCLINPKTVISCVTVDDTACNKNLCNPNTGTCSLTAIKNGSPCDDADACTTGDICLQGTCKAGTNTCLCKSDADCDGKDDGNLCNGLPFCNLQTGTCDINPVSIVTCPSVDDTPCAKNACVPKTGKCASTPIAEVMSFCDLPDKADKSKTCRFEVAPTGSGKSGTFLCSDGDVCTAGDSCKGDQCVSGTFICGCKSDADCASNEDDNLCNGTLYCDKLAPVATCKVNKATVVSCPAGEDTGCLKNTCQPKLGKCVYQPLLSGTPCDDGNDCTKADACLAGACSGTNTCECSVSADCADKEDGNACNGTLYCDKSGKAPKCTINPASVVICPAYVGSVCLKNLCNLSNGQCLPAPTNDGGKCDDGTNCTAGDVCAKGQCAGNALDCDDKNPCTQDSCDVVKGCKNTAENCNDGNDCTTDLCDPKTGKCGFDKAAQHGKGCNADGDGCTVNDICKLGECQAGQQITCTIPLQPCQKAACISTSASNFQCLALPADDGQACDDGDACKLGSTCKAGQCAKGDKDRLFTRLFSSPDTHNELRAVASAGDGYVVAGGRSVGLLSAAKSQEWLVNRVNAWGETQWTVTVSVPTPDPDAIAQAVAGLADNTVVVAGATKAEKNVGMDAHVVKLSANGKDVLWKETHGKAGVVDDVLTTLVPLPIGDIMVGGWQDDGEVRNGWLVRLNELGKLTEQWAYAGDWSASVAAMLPRLDGGFTLAGWTHAKLKPESGWLIGVTAQGTVKWTHTFSGGAGQGLNALAADPSGYVAAGWHQDGDVRRTLVIKTDAAGNKLWQSVSSGIDEAWGVAYIGGGQTMVAGRAGATEEAARRWLRGLDSQGFALWDSAQQLGTHGALRALSLTTDGTLVTAGHTRPDGVTKGSLMRMDAWGHVSCQSGGKCAGLKASQCDDSNTCTDDYCTAQDGCVHANNAVACDDGDACTGGDRCKLAKCLSSKKISCDDGNSCTSDSCDVKSGCNNVPGGSFCDDGDKCTEGDKCIGGACKAEPKSCDDGDFCTLDGCDAKLGCSHAKGDAKVCDDGNLCTKDACVDGTKKDKIGACGHDAKATDGKSCEDGKNCTVAETCLGGSCQGGGNKLFHLPVSFTDGKSGHDNPTARSLLHMANGDFVAAGRFLNGLSVVRISPTGQTVWRDASKAGPQGFDGNPRYATGIAAYANGDIAVVGMGQKHPLPRWAITARRSGSGSYIWTRPHSSETETRAFEDVVIADDQSVLSIGAIGPDGARKIWLVLHNPDGSYRWQRTFGSADNEYGVAGRCASDQGFLALSHAGTGSRLRKVSAIGQLLWQRRYDEMGLSEVLATSEGFVLGGAAHCGGAGCDAVFLRADQQGREIGRVTYGSPAGHDGIVAMAAAQDGFVVAGAGFSGGGRCWVARVSRNGQMVWQSFVPPAAGHDQCIFMSVVQTADGGMMLVGETGTGHPNQDFLFVRTDAWGHLSCKDAAMCAKFDAKDCEDGDICTDDLCEPAKGCVNKNNASDCNDGNPCTLAGSCKDGSCQTGPGRFWDVTLGDQADQQAIGILSRPDGGFHVVAATQVAKHIDTLVVAVDASGTATSKKVYSGGGKGGMVPHALVETKDGGFAVFGGFAQYASGTPPLDTMAGLPGALFFDGAGGPGKLVEYGTCGGYTCGSTTAFPWGADHVFVGGVDHDKGQSVTAFAVDMKGSPVLHDSGKPYKFGEPKLGGLTGAHIAAGVSVDAKIVLLVGHATVDGSNKQGFAGVLRAGSGFSMGPWSKTYGGAGDDGFAAGVRMPDGGVLVGGWSSSHGAGGKDGWLVSLDDLGRVHNQRTFGLAKDDTFTRVVSDGRGGWLATGSTASLGAGKKDGWLVAVDPDLHPMWQQTYGGKEDDNLVDLSVLAGGELALLGNTRSKGAGGQDIWLIRTDPWGRYSCGETGKCVTENVGTCDDLDPCTVDTCDKDKGCIHTSSPTACVELASCPKADGWKDPPLQQREQFDALHGKPSVADEAAAVLDLGDGRVQVAGQRWELAGKLSDGWMAQTSAAGEVLWERGWGGSEADRLEAMVRHPGGGTLAAGASASMELGNAGGHDGWLARVSDDGTLLWTRTYGSGDDDSLWGLTVAKDGTVVAVGRSKSNSAGGFDGWLVRTDASGTPTWQGLVGGKGIDYLFDVVTAGKDALAAGYSKSNAPAGTAEPYTAKGGFDLWLVRLDGAGKTLWDRRFGTDKDDFGSALLRTADDGLVVAGRSLGFGFGDAMLWRFDKEGDPVWQRNFGGKDLVDSATALAPMPGGGFALAGFTASKGQGKQDGWVVVTGVDGKLAWDRTIGTSADERLNAIAPLRHGGFALAGVREEPDSQAWLLRTNNWGFADCTAAGKCAHLGPDLCDDGVACTADTCDVNKGCTHTLIPGAGDCPPLNDKAKPGKTCSHIKKADPGAKSGRYWVNPGGNWKGGAVLVGCDMETDGGGWTLVLALPRDTPPEKWRLHDVANSGDGVGGLADGLVGEVAAPAWMPTHLLDSLAGAGGVELLADVGAGLFRMRFNSKSSKSADVLSVNFAIYDPDYATAFGAGVDAAEGRRTPTQEVAWRPTTGTFRTGDGCPTGACPYLPADVVGPWQQAHRIDAAPAAGYDGRAPRYAKVFLRVSTADCDDGKKCTHDAARWPSGCAHLTANCDDGLPCTTDSCDEVKGCQHSAKVEGVSCSSGVCKPGICKAGECEPDKSATCGSESEPAPSCAAIHVANSSAKDGAYFIDRDGPMGPAPPFQAECLHSAAGGGWSKLVPAVLKTIPVVEAKEYLYVANDNRWYRSPKTKHVWSWSSPYDLTGTYGYFDGKQKATFECNKAVEKSKWGVGCSVGEVGGDWKVLCWNGYDAEAATGTICQDNPNAFGTGPCATATFYVRW